MNSEHWPSRRQRPQPSTASRNRTTMARLHLLVCLVAVSLTALNAAPTDSDVSTPATDVPSTAAPTTEDPSCVPACPAKKAGSVPNLCNCQKYFDCDENGQMTDEICMPWENFNPKTGECAFWDEVDCDSSKPTTVPPPPPSTTEASVVPGCSFKPECPAEGSSTMGVPCPDSCKIYVECNNGKWSKKSCPLWAPWFDVKSSKCVLWGAQCAE